MLYGLSQPTPERLVGPHELQPPRPRQHTSIGEKPKLLAPAYPGLQTGLFVKDGDNLVHMAETIDGKLIVNRKAVVLSPPSGLQPTAASI